MPQNEAILMYFSWFYLRLTKTQIENSLKFSTVHDSHSFSLHSSYGSGMLEDNLVARVYTSYETEGHFLAFYTVLNCYVYLLAYVYSPTSSQAKDTHVMRDNPAFSMINESDEETEGLLPGDPAQDSAKDNKARLHNPKRKSHPPALVNLGHDDDSD